MIARDCSNSPLESFKARDHGPELRSRRRSTRSGDSGTRRHLREVVEVDRAGRRRPIRLDQIGVVTEQPLVGGVLVVVGRQDQHVCETSIGCGFRQRHAVARGWSAGAENHPVRRDSGFSKVAGQGQSV